MTLPANHPITAQQVNVELGRSAGAVFNMNGTSERTLANKPSGSYSFGDFLGKSAGGGPAPDPDPVTASVTDSAGVSGTAIGTLSIGAANAARLVVLTVFQNSFAGGSSVNITCGGNTMSKQTVYSGSIGGGETGRMTVYWLAVAAGTTAAFVASSSIGAQVVVWRLLNAGAGVFDFSSNVAAASSVSLPACNIPANGALLIHAALGQQDSAMTFTGTGVSEQLDVSNTAGGLVARLGAAKREVASATNGATAGVSNTGSSVAVVFGATFGN